MPNGIPDVAKSIQRTLRGLVITTVVLAILLGAGGYLTAQSANSNRQSLCALRLDLEDRVERSEAFLKRNPEGIPGIDARIIKDGVNGQKRTIHALSTLDCKPRS